MSKIWVTSPAEVLYEGKGNMERGVEKTSYKDEFTIIQLVNKRKVYSSYIYILFLLQMILHECINHFLLSSSSQYAIQILLVKFNWLSGKESTCQCRRRGFDP